MTLKLNSTGEANKEFYGRNIEQMPKLIADGRVPMNTAQLMQKRLDVRNSEDIKSGWLDNYFDTGDAIAYHPDGRSKIILDSQTLREMTPESPRWGALILTPEAYDTLEGEEFKKDQTGKLLSTITGDWMSKADVKSHPVWKALARDQVLLDDYTDYIFAEANERFNYDTVMGVFLSPAEDFPEDFPEIRAWAVLGLDSWSHADSGGDLGHVSGRFVGIAPKTLSVPRIGF